MTTYLALGAISLALIVAARAVLRAGKRRNRESR
jgi:hypothetical protein